MRLCWVLWGRAICSRVPLEKKESVRYVRLTSLPESCFRLPFEVESAQAKAPESVPDPQQEIAYRLPTCDGRGEKDVQSRDCYR